VGTAAPGRPSRAQLGRFVSNLSTLSDENSPRMLGRVLRYARSWKSGPSGPRQQRVKSGFSPGSTAAHLSSSLSTLPSCRRLTRWPTRTRHSATSLRNSESKSTEEYSMSLHTWLNMGALLTAIFLVSHAIAANPSPRFQAVAFDYLVLFNASSIVPAARTPAEPLEPISRMVAHRGSGRFGS